MIQSLPPTDTLDRRQKEDGPETSPSPDRYTRSAVESGWTEDSALPPTYTLDRRQKEEDRPQVKTRSVHRRSVFTRIGTATHGILVHTFGFFYGSNPSRGRSQESSRGPWTLRIYWIYTPKDLREYVLCY